MANEIQKGSVPTIPSVGAPITQVNQYGDHSVHADHVENLSVTVIENQGSPTEDENGVPFVPLAPTRFDSTTRIIYLGIDKVKLPIQLTPQNMISAQELPYVNALCEVYAEKNQRSCNARHNRHLVYRSSQEFCRTAQSLL